MDINTDVIKGQWSQIKGTLKEKWGKLTDNDLQSFDGNFETLKGKLQQLYGYSKERASAELDETVQKLKLKGNEAREAVMGKANQAVDESELKVDNANRKLNR